jgi:hypothetical protein
MSRALAALCLGALLAGDGLPLVAGLLADAPAAMCGAGGRCCCAGAPGPADDGRPCIRRACGCGSAEEATLPLLLRAPALLPAAGARATLDPASGLPRPSAARPAGGPPEPSVPPPKALLHA